LRGNAGRNAENYDSEGRDFSSHSAEEDKSRCCNLAKMKSHGAMNL
jgi:hypothetical protein